MAKKPKQQATISPPAPFEQKTETPETPDIQAFRAFDPSAKINMLSETLAKRFGDRRKQIYDSYGAYSGIPSEVARNRMHDEALRELDESEALALAEGSERAQALKMAQLESLANLTRKNRASGYNTSVIQPQQSNLIPSLISGASGIAIAALGRNTGKKTPNG
jgi:hypothetical protein